MKRQNSLSLFKTVISIYSLSGTFPKVEKKLSKYYSLLLIVLYGVGCFSFVNYFWKIIVIEENRSKIGYVIECGRIISIATFNLISIIKYFIHRKLWKQFMESLEKLDLNLRENRSQTDELVVPYFLKFLVPNLACIIIFLLIFWSYKDNIDHVTWFCYGYLFFVYMQVIGTTLVLYSLLKNMTRIFLILRTIIIKQYHPMNTGGQWDSLRIKEFYILFSETVNNINKIFGKRILVLLSFIFFFILSIFQFIFLENQMEQKKILTIPLVLIYICFLFVSIYLFI